MTILWTAELETGIRHIDLQHQELVSLINQVTDALAQGRDQELLDQILPKLAGYVVFHFGSEESLLANAGVLASHAQHHRSAHHAFSARIQQLKRACADGSASANALPELADYLQSWLMDHIVITDKELARQIRNAPRGLR
jgi:hemerythrin